MAGREPAAARLRRQVAGVPSGPNSSAFTPRTWRWRGTGSWFFARAGNAGKTDATRSPWTLSEISARGGMGPARVTPAFLVMTIEPIDWGAAVSEIWGHYHATLTDAASKGISAEQLTTYDPEEKLAAQFPGFQPRFGGRIDMDIPFG